MTAKIQVSGYHRTGCGSERCNGSPPNSYVPKGNAKAVVKKLAEPFKLSQGKKESQELQGGMESRADVESQHSGMLLLECLS